MGLKYYEKTNFIEFKRLLNKKIVQLSKDSLVKYLSVNLLLFWRNPTYNISKSERLIFLSY
jgi:hypothetical protein